MVKSLILCWRLSTVIGNVALFLFNVFNLQNKHKAPFKKTMTPGGVSAEPRCYTVHPSLPSKFSQTLTLQKRNRIDYKDFLAINNEALNFIKFSLNSEKRDLEEDAVEVFGNLPNRFLGDWFAFKNKQQFDWVGNLN